MTKKQVIQLINNYWKFDNDQDTTSTWHDKQDLINEIEQLEEMQKAGVSQQRELLQCFCKLANITHDTVNKDIEETIYRFNAL